MEQKEEKGKERKAGNRNRKGLVEGGPLASTTRLIFKMRGNGRVNNSNKSLIIIFILLRSVMYYYSASKFNEDDRGCGRGRFVGGGSLYVRKRLCFLSCSPFNNNNNVYLDIFIVFLFLLNFLFQLFHET